MTSIMDDEQRRALQKAARSGKSDEAKALEAKELERPTARPPPEAAAAAAAIADEVAIPKAPAVPSEAKPKAPEPSAAPSPAASRAVPAPAKAPAAPAGMDTLSIVAFVLLAAAVAFATMR